MDKLRKAMKPVYLLARFIALVPARYNQATLYETHPFNIYEFLYAPILIILISAGAICKYIMFDSESMKNSILPFFHEHAIILFSIFALIMAQIKFDEMNQTAMLFDETETKLRIFRCDLQYKFIYKIEKIIAATYIITQIFLQLPIVFSLVFLSETFNTDGYTENVSRLERLSKLILIFIARIISVAVRVYFFHFMIVLRLRFGTVNRELNKIAKITENESKLSNNNNQISTSSSANNNNNNNQNNNSNDSSKKRSNRNRINNLKILTVVSHTGDEQPLSHYNGEFKRNTRNTSIRTPDSISPNQLHDEITKLKIRNLSNSNNFHNYDPFGNKHYLKIRLLADIHDKLCLNLATVNSIFSLQLLFIIGIEFVLITASLYFEYTQIDKGFINYTEIIAYTMDVIGNFLRCIQLLLLIWICSNTCSQANQASFYVHKIVYMEESKLKREIENFSMQLLHNKVQISAGGFFPIDFTLLYTIVGAITTYLVILVQFYLAGKAAPTKRPPMNNETLEQNTVEE